MTSAKYVGYLSGAAVAAGIGAAMAVAGQGTAHANTESPSVKDSTSAPDTSAGAVDAGPKRRKPLAKLGDQIEKITAEVAKPVTSALKPATVKKPKTTPAQFEAEQVKRLQNLFEPSKKTTAKAATTPTVMTSAVQTAAVAATPNDPNPFRAVDPDPTDMPAAVLGTEKALVAALPAPLQPFVREGYEAAYRVSQMVPWVNTVVPITAILPAVQQAAAGNKDGAQVIVNQLLLTTPPVSFLYYGYDEVADLLNVEEQADALKKQFYATVWDTVDFPHLLHNPGQSGI